MACGSLQQINVVIALSIREAVNENSEPRYIGFVKNRSPMKALTNHVVPSRSAQLVHFPMVLLFLFTLTLTLSHTHSLSFSAFLSFILSRYTFAHTDRHAHIHAGPECIDLFYYPLFSTCEDQLTQKPKRTSVH